MGELAADRPKPMLPIGGRPVLARQIDLAAQAGLHRVEVLTGWRSEVIERELPSLAPHGTELAILREPEPAGSGGCLRLLPDPEVPRLVMLGDLLVQMDLGALLAFHESARRESGALATVVVHPNDHPADSDLVEAGPDGRIRRLHRKPHPEGLIAPNRVIAGVFLLEPEALRAVPPQGAADLVQVVLGGLIERGAPVYAYTTTEYLKDMGTPKRYAQARRDLERGAVEARHRRHPRPTAFLDRDGTLNHHVGYLTRAEELRLLPGAAEAVRRLNHAGALAVVVTNQPVLARGMCTEPDLERIHARMEMELGRHGAFLDRIYHCPHHPDAGFAGEVPALKVACDCRKPAPGMIELAARELPVDLSRSALFGDSRRDVETALRAGIEPWLLGGEDVESGENGERGMGLPAEVRRAPDLAGAVDRWLGRGDA
jgi:histidinol-phosphate phosphatase family protein